jgi:superfamily II DNA or RNA helicase
VDAGVVGGGERRVAPVTIGVVQALTRWEPRELSQCLRGFGLVILDEAHHAASVTFRSIIDRCPARYRLGLTATPDREDGLTPLLELHFGPPLKVVTQRELVAAGVLARAEVVLVPTRFTYPYRTPVDYAPMLAQLAGDDARNGLIVSAVSREAEAGHVCLVLTGRVEHCERLAALLRAEGVRAAALTGSTKPAERTRLLSDARAGALSVLVATSLADEGLDLPRLSRAFLVFPGRAHGRTVQRIGRIMRPHPEKRDAVLFDFVDQEIPILRRHALERRRAYAQVLGAPPVALDAGTSARRTG